MWEVKSKFIKNLPVSAQKLNVCLLLICPRFFFYKFNACIVSIYITSYYNVVYQLSGNCGMLVTLFLFRSDGRTRNRYCKVNATAFTTIIITANGCCFCCYFFFYINIYIIVRCEIIISLSVMGLTL